MPLLELHHLLLMLHVHGGHHVSLLSYHLPQILCVVFLLFDFALQLGARCFGRDQLDKK